MKKISWEKSEAKKYLKRCLQNGTVTLNMTYTEAYEKICPEFFCCMTVILNVFPAGFAIYAKKDKNNLSGKRRCCFSSISQEFLSGGRKTVARFRG